MGVGGTGYKRTSEKNTAFYQRISSVPLDTDVITIFGSLNDLGASVPIGTASDTGTDTLGGAINTTLDNLNSRLPVYPSASSRQRHGNIVNLGMRAIPQRSILNC